jgi:hypothetical protein
MQDKKKRDHIDQLVTMREFGHFTDEVILPGVERMLDDKIGTVRQEMGALRQEMVDLISDLGSEMRAGFHEIRTALKAFSGDHEARITRLEQHVGLQERKK